MSRLLRKCGFYFVLASILKVAGFFDLYMAVVHSSEITSGVKFERSCADVCLVILGD